MYKTISRQQFSLTTVDICFNSHTTILIRMTLHPKIIAYGGGKAQYNSLYKKWNSIDLLEMNKYQNLISYSLNS